MTWPLSLTPATALYTVRRALPCTDQELADLARTPDHLRRRNDDIRFEPVNLPVDTLPPAESGYWEWDAYYNATSGMSIPEIQQARYIVDGCARLAVTPVALTRTLWAVWWCSPYGEWRCIELGARGSSAAMQIGAQWLRFWDYQAS